MRLNGGVVNNSDGGLIRMTNEDKCLQATQRRWEPRGVERRHAGCHANAMPGMPRGETGGRREVRVVAPQLAASNIALRQPSQNIRF